MSFKLPTYSPQSIERQIDICLSDSVFNEKTYYQEIIDRFNYLKNKNLDFPAAKLFFSKQTNPFSNIKNKTYYEEYGFDVFSITFITFKNFDENNLESSFKWLEKLHSTLSDISYQKISPKKQMLYLQSIYTYIDYFTNRNEKLHFILSIVRTIFKNRWFLNCKNFLSIFLALLYPFTPFTALKFLKQNRFSITLNKQTISKIFPKFLCKKVAFKLNVSSKRGGFFWLSIDKKLWEKNWIKALMLSHLPSNIKKRLHEKQTQLLKIENSKGLIFTLK